MAEDVAISVKGVSKDFILSHEKVQSVKHAFTGMFNRNRTTEVQHALKDINFEVKKGEFFGIVGRNGSGKSTLLKILAGIYQPTQGDVHVAGKLVPFIELGVGFNPELTGRENIYLNGAMLGFSEKQVAAMYDDIVAFAELERFMDQKLKNYSSGMQVRLAFSMATRSEADILLVDEVLAVGDADFQRKCFNYFKSLKKRKKTVVFVSHDMGAVREYCDRAILVQESEIKAEGKADLISQAYLKLFNEQATDNEDEIVDEGNRWGNRWATLETVKHILSDSELKITCRIKAHRDLTGLVQGFRVRASDGTELLGTNNTILGLPHITLKSGAETTIEWSTPNVFSNGDYYIDPSIVMRDGATVCDWWNEAITFRVNKDNSTSYPVTPDIRCHIGSVR